MEKKGHFLAVVLVIVAFVVGYNWNTWFPKKLS